MSDSMTDRELIEICLSITGAFEGGSPSYTTVSGNADGQGISVGILQWNAGQRTLQNLLVRISQRMAGGWDAIEDMIPGAHHLSVLNSHDAIAFCMRNYISPIGTHLTPEATAHWKNFLSQPGAIQSQIELATEGVLARAKRLAVQFCPGYEINSRVLAFFFDLVTQSGGMQNARGSVGPIAIDDPFVDKSDALVLQSANDHNQDCYAIWYAAIQSDKLAAWLAHYAYQRSQLSRTEYIWDALTRRCTIACRGGFVHGAKIDLTDKLV